MDAIKLLNVKMLDGIKIASGKEYGDKLIPRSNGARVSEGPKLELLPRSKPSM